MYIKASGAILLFLGLTFLFVCGTQTKQQPFAFQAIFGPIFILLGWQLLMG